MLDSQELNEKLNSLDKPSQSRRFFLKEVGFGFSGLVIKELWHPQKLLAQSSTQTNRLVFIHAVAFQPPNSAYANEQLDHVLDFYSPDSSLNNLQTHVSKIRSYGIDVVTLNVFIRPDWTPGDAPDDVIYEGKYVTDWMTAIKAVDPAMRFSLCLDRSSPNITKAQWITCINGILNASFTKNSAYLKQDGKPVLLSFWSNQYLTGQDWQYIRQRITLPCVFIGDVVPNPGAVPPHMPPVNRVAIEEMAVACDGLSANTLATNLEWLKETYPVLADVAHDNNKPFYWGVGPGYYRDQVAFIEPQFDYLHYTWMSAINSAAVNSKDRNVIIFTWNDLEEDTNCWTSVNKGQALLELHRFYSQWFHTGNRPNTGYDLVFLNYPKFFYGELYTSYPQGVEAPHWPRVNYWALLTSNAQLQLPGLGSVNLTTGLNIGYIATPPTASGLPSQFSLVRGSTIVLSAKIPSPMAASTTANLVPPMEMNLTYRWVALHRVNVAFYVSQSVPQVMALGRRYPVSVTMRNDGLVSWSTSERYSLATGANYWGVSSVPMPITVNPGQTVTFNFTVTAPSTSGTYNFQWSMLRDTTFFNVPSVNVPVNVGTAIDSASYVSQVVPTSMAKGQRYNVSVTMKNNGNTPWSTSERYSLATGASYWGVLSVPMPRTVNPGQTVTFNFTVTAPSTSGTYNFQWSMLRDTTFFNVPSVIVRVTVPS